MTVDDNGGQRENDDLVQQNTAATNNNNNNINNNNTNHKSKSKVELILSRPSYQTGTSVLGTVRLSTTTATTSHNNHNHNINHAFTSAHIYLAGRCRIDPRWHDAQSLAALYGTHPCHDRLPSFVEERVVDSYFGTSATGNDLDGGSSPRRGSGGRRRQLHLQLQRRKGLEKAACVCFWSTNVVTLWNTHGNENGNGNNGNRNGNEHDNGNGDIHGNNHEHENGNKNEYMYENGHGNTKKMIMGMEWWVWQEGKEMFMTMIIKMGELFKM